MSMALDFGLRDPGHIIRDVNKWALNAVQNVGYKNGTAADLDANTDDNFWNYLSSHQNSTGTVQITTDNTWTTLIDITGKAGLVGNIVGPAAALGAWDCVTDVEITCDGKLETFDLTIPDARTNEYRMLFGSFTPSYDLAGTGTDLNLPMSYYDLGFDGNKDDGIKVIPGGVGVVPVQSLLSAGLPVLRFEDNFKVRVRANHVTNTPLGTDRHQRAGVFYALDWDT